MFVDEFYHPEREALHRAMARKDANGVRDTARPLAETQRHFLIDLKFEISNLREQHAGEQHLTLKGQEILCVFATINVNGVRDEQDTRAFRPMALRMRAIL